MRRLISLVLALAILTTGCTSGSDDPDPKAAKDDRPVTLEALRLDWPKAQGRLDVGDRPKTPKGFDDEQLDRMATILTRWAKASAVDDTVWHSADPFADVKKTMPPKAAATLDRRIEVEVSPHLGAANVFGDDVTVVGTPMVTTAWKLTST